MRLVTRILFGLTGFLAVAAGVYWVTNHQGAGRDPAGPALMGIAAVAFGYTGLVLRAAARRADRSAADERPQAAAAKRTAGPHAPPTIWPFAFSIAALALVVGAVAATGILVPLGLALFAGAAVGWSADVRRSHRH